MRNIILILCFFTTINIFADLHFGAKVGVNFNNIDKNETIMIESENIEYTLNFSGGIFLKKHLNDYFYINIEGLYNRKGFQVIDEQNIETSVITNYIEFPVLLGISFNSFYVYTGLYFANFINSEEESCKGGKCYESKSSKYDKELESSDTGIILGFGYQLNNFLFDLRYSKGISDINVAPKGADDYTGIDNFYQFIFSVGFMFK